MEKKRNKILSLFLVFVFSIMFLYLPVDAAGKAQISMTTVRSSGATYESTSTFTVGEKIYLPINVSGISNTKVGGFACEITYNSDVLAFSNDTWTTVSDEDAVFYKYDKNGTVTLLWDTVSAGTVFDGDVIYVVFESKEDISEDTDLKFTLTVEDFYELSNDYPNIPYEISAKTVNAKIVIESIPQNVVQAFQKLEVVKATQESLDNIVDAEMLWESLTNNQQKLFVKNYGEEYDWFSTARNRYNKAVNQASIDEINRQVEDFKTTYGAVLALTTETVTTRHADAVDAATKAYEILPTSVTTRLDQGIPQLLEDLGERIEELEEAKAEAETFISEYSETANITESMLESNYTAYSVMVDEAMMMYDILSEDAKSLVSELYEKLAALQKKSDEIAAANEALAVTRDEVNAYQQKWLKVFTLNAGNVSIADKTAIEMAIADYAKLSKPAQESLASRITMLKSLLSKIETSSEGSSGGSTDGSATNNGSEGSGQTQVKETIVEKEVMVKITEYLNKNVPKTIWFLLILLAIAILTLLFPFIMTLRYKKYRAKFDAIQTLNRKEGNV